eukprot:403336510
MSMIQGSLGIQDNVGISSNSKLIDLYFQQATKNTNTEKKSQEIFFSIDIMKFNERLGLQQKRVIVITNETTNILRKNSYNQTLVLKRRIHHREMRGLTKSLSNHYEFIIHPINQHDIRLLSDQRELILQYLQECYLRWSTKNIPLFGISDEKLFESQVTTSSQFKHYLQKPLPEDQYRLIDEEIKIEEFDPRELISNIQGEETEELMNQSSTFNLVYAREDQDKDIKLTDFEILNLIGKGSISNVYLIKKKGNNRPFAMKCIQKELVMEDDMFEATKLEKDLLVRLNSPFFVNLHYSFQSETKILFVMDFVRGGDLFMHLMNLGQFTEDSTRFIIAQLVLALGNLHSFSILYRDLKLENILINDNGYISMVDFGISKELDFSTRERTYSVRGTPEYMAPDMLNSNGYSFPVDWWALGTITFEMLVGTPPFYEDNQSMMFKKIMKQKLKFPSDVPLSKDCRDFIEKLLHKDPTKRLGNNGYQDVIKHPFFNKIDFQALQNKQLDAPYKPFLTTDVFDVSNFEQELTSRTTFEDGRYSLSKADMIRTKASMFRKF